MSESTYFKTSRAADEVNTLSLKRMLVTVLTFWPRFLGFILIALFIALLYLRYTSPVYNIHAKLLILDDKSPGNIETNIFQGMGLVSKRRSVDNEIEVLKSFSLMEKVVKNLHLNIRYYTCGKIKSIELYKNKPFVIELLNSDSTVPFLGEFKLRYKNGIGSLLVNEKKYSFQWGDTLLINEKKMVIRKSSDQVLSGQDYLVKVENVNSVINEYLSSFTVATPSKVVSALSLNIKDNLPEKGEVVLNKLIEIYLKSDIEDKNRIADNTISFIEDRLAYVGNELSGVENTIEGFKKNNLSFVGNKPNLLQTDAHDFEFSISHQRVQVIMIESLEAYLNNSSNKQKPLPSASLLQQDPHITEIITRYNDLKLSRDRLLFSNTEDNPAIHNLDMQMETLRQDLKSSLALLKRNLLTSINALNTEADGIKKEIQTVPNKERVFTDISRQQITKQELYLFLLKKREETAITKSSTIADARIIDYAQREGQPVLPNKSQIIMSALLLGIIIPSLSVYFQRLFNNKIFSKADVLQNTQTPILGEIGHNDKDNILVMQAGSRSIMAEQFRSLRTNIQFILPDKKQRTLLLTSSMSGEGKSFIAVNLANTLAIADKKVLLIEFDLRKPRISKFLNLDNTIGFTNYAIGLLGLQDIIMPSGINDNFFIISGGQAPPNPTELILLSKVDDMFAELKARFDFIIIDTAPIGLVTDAQLLSKYADATLYVLRQGYTYKQQLDLVEEIYAGKKMPNFNLVINDIKFNSANAYGKGYGQYGGFAHKYGAHYTYNSYYLYGNNSYFDESLSAKLKLPFLTKWFKRKKEIGKDA